LLDTKYNFVLSWEKTTGRFYSRPDELVEFFKKNTHRNRCL
jgi:hypothetical protein